VQHDDAPPRDDDDEGWRAALVHPCLCPLRQAPHSRRGHAGFFGGAGP
jgi:hypothetical protein